MTLIDGKATAAKIKEEIAEEVVAVPQRKRRQRKPGKYLKA